jgi:hypothetical protein
MIALSSGVRVYLACGITDMRRGMASRNTVHITPPIPKSAVDRRE